MTRSLVVFLVLAVSVTAAATAQPRISRELQALADAERAFARAATVKGIRDAFLEFFADDAVALRPTPTPAKEQLRQQKPVPASVRELVWEPGTGDVAASGDLGWLTGPSTFTDHSTPGAKPAYGNYLSVWRRQPDGQWRVYIDVGVDTPTILTFVPSFSRFRFGARYAGKAGKAAATISLLDADRDLNNAVATAGTAAAYAERLTDASRLHRSGVMTIVGPAGIRDWLSANAPAVAALGGGGESAESGELGFTYGIYERKGLPPQSGAYVRVWTRDAAGTWWMAADVTQPTPPPL